MFKISILMIPVAVLAGCTGLGNTERDFLCSAQSGQACRSISEVDGSSARATGSLREDALDTQNQSITQDPIFTGKKGAAAALPGGFPYQSGRYRVPEKTGRIWIAPYLDDAKILHEGTHVHVVLRKARWGTQ